MLWKHKRTAWIAYWWAFGRWYWWDYLRWVWWPQHKVDITNLLLLLVGSLALWGTVLLFQGMHPQAGTEWVCDRTKLVYVAGHAGYACWYQEKP